MKLVVLTILIVFSITRLSGQESIQYRNEEINQIDSKGQKQGVWKVYSPDDTLHAECIYTNDIIKGEIKIFLKGINIIRFTNPNEVDRKFVAYYGSDTITGITTFVEGKPTLIDSNGKEIVGKVKQWIAMNSSIMAKYYGGQEKFIEHIQENLNTMNTKGEKGKAIIKFAINKYGQINDLKIKNKTHRLIIEKVIRVMKTVPRWQPGFQRGTFVKTPFTFPINID